MNLQLSINSPVNTICKKLLLKPGKRWLIYNVPVNYPAALEPLPDGAAITFHTGGDVDGIQLFVKNSAELEADLKTIVPLLKPDTIFWITYPKKSSGIKSDLEMMSSWDELDRYGYNGVAAAAINETWTALRFRPKGQSKVSDSCNEEIRKNEYAEYIDVDKRQVTIPQDMQQALAQSTAALAFYQGLSYSNKKEYVVWILSAKQEKTKNERLVKLVEKLSEGKKNPADK